ncbi:uncharacterized protein LOC122246026 [Penaeus japonicus]|uniref:uncharacterized protein LOC122246026 n=1 Tax=Penaeus japonicus TaxID=27405 RepID=UPI001C7149DB|nr:uncharacterized protein LOC122246026 [Penaeus japonicus]
MQSVVACVLVFVGVASAALSAGGFAPSPWVDTSMCSPTDSLMACQLKKGQCSPVGTVFSPPGGPVKAITSCANTTGVVLGPQFFMSIGLAFVSGNPESLADKTSSDPATATAIRRCALNTTGLLNADMMTLNRTAVTAAVASAFSSPAVGAAVASAVASCPEPVDYKITDFVSCLKTACMENVSVSPFMQMATASFQSMVAPPPAGAPTAA